MRALVLGCPIDILTMSETIELARRSMDRRARLQHVALNVAKLVNMRLDPVLANDVAGSDIIGIDGMGIVLAARVLGMGAPERVAGIDLFLKLMAICGAHGYRPFLLGGTKMVVEEAARRIAQKYPA